MDSKSSTEWVKPPSNSQHTIMLEDILAHGFEKSGVYKGVPWKMVRPYRTYWCGYVNYYESKDHSYMLTDEDIEELEGRSHGGLTSGIGFDCAHFYDYYPTTGVNTLLHDTKFCTHDYVYGRITSMIDYIMGAIAEKENGV
jgi:hypothetical protein